MSSEVAIKVENLGKCYHIYNKPQDRLLQMLSLGHKRYFREFWALKDVSFVIHKGETVGIVGRNGSGKSTLLQIICGTLAATNGTIEVNGRIAALLELGAGFNPEFTGRENVYMNGALLGLEQQEIEAKFDDIAAFADIGDFIERPIKTYSSGMTIRLAFAVAIHADPQILVVDEALAVGDELFQRKCFSRIEAIKKTGATILFVSHAGSTIVELCDRAILLDTGEMLAAGSPKEIVGNYQKLLYAPANRRDAIRTQVRHALVQKVATTNMEENTESKNGQHVNMDEIKEYFDPDFKPTSTIEYESHGAYIESPEIYTMEGVRVNGLVKGGKYKYSYRVRFEKALYSVRFGMSIKTVSGVPLGGALSVSNLGEAIPLVEAGAVVFVEFIFNCVLNPDSYFMNAGVFGCPGDEEIVIHRLVDATAFRVLPVFANTATGIVDFNCVSLVSFDD